MSPLFTIAIPTRNRARLARMAAGFVLSQDFTDFELLLLDNSDTRELLDAEFGDSRCRVVPSTVVLSMRDNWERVLDLAKGDFVIVLSDKDMMLPRALGRLAKIAVESSTDVITFRKACYGHEEAFHSTIQVCSGRTFSCRSADVLETWFQEVRHFHDAPMLYNSAARRSVLVELKKSVGQLLVGTSPDVASGAVLMAKVREYRLLDSPLVLSWYGSWSIGVSSGRGEHGASAAYLAEFGSNPIRDAGLVTSVAGSVGETLLSCKAQFPGLFANYSVSWPRYIRSVRWELFKRERTGIQSKSEVKYLYSPSKKPYNGIHVVLGVLRFHWERIDLLNRCRTKLKRLFVGDVTTDQQASPDGRGVAEIAHNVAKEVEAYFTCRAPSSASFRDIPLYSLSPALTFDEAYLVATEISDRLSGFGEEGAQEAATLGARRPAGRGQ